MMVSINNNKSELIGVRWISNMRLMKTILRNCCRKINNF